MGSRLSAVTLDVKDFDASCRFYRDLLGINFGQPHGDKPGDAPHVHAAWGSRDDATNLALTLHPAGSEPVSHSRIGFAVDDIDAFHGRLVRAGIPVVRAIKEMPWGRSAIYSDPDGNAVTLTQYRSGSSSH